MNNNPYSIKGIEPIRIQKGSGMIRFEFTNDVQSPIRLRLSAVPSLPEMKGKQATKGQNKYDFDNKINIDLTARELSMLTQQFNLFLDGRLPAFQKNAKKNRVETTIFHDSSKHEKMDNSAPNRIVEFEAKNNDYYNAFLRVKLQQAGKDINRVNILLDYFDISYLRDTLRQAALILQGLSQENILMIYKGNITNLPPKTNVSQFNRKKTPEPNNHGNKPKSTMPIPRSL